MLNSKHKNMTQRKIQWASKPYFNPIIHKLLLKKSKHLLLALENWALDSDASLGILEMC